MLFTKQKKKQKTALFMCAGKQWFYCDENNCEAFESGIIDIPPQGLFRRCAEERVKSVYIIVPAEINIVNFELPKELEYEEKHSVLIWELSATTGCNPENSRISFSPAANFDFGGAMDTWFCACFPESSVRRFKNIMADNGIEFKGLGSFQLSMALEHSRHKNKVPENLLVVREANSFIVIPGRDGEAPLCRNMPLGTSGAIADSENWSERIKKRLVAVSGQGIRLVVSDETAVQSVSGIIKKELMPREFSAESLSETIKNIYGPATENNSLYAFERPREKDPRAPGTWFAVLVLALTCSMLLFQWGWGQFTKNSLEEKIRLGEILDKERKNVTGKLKNLEDKISSKIKMFNLISEHRVISPDFMFLLNSIHKAIPEYTKLSGICQKDDCVVITGSALAQRDIAELGRKLAELLKTGNIKIQPREVNTAKDGLEKIFSFKIEKTR